MRENINLIRDCLMSGIANILLFVEDSKNGQAGVKSLDQTFVKCDNPHAKKE